MQRIKNEEKMFIKLLHRDISAKTNQPVEVHGRRLVMADETGEATIEWALVLAAIVLPMFFIFRICLDLLVAHYQMVTFMETLPFP